MTIRCRLTVNGQEVDCQVEPRTTLADLLRDELGLTGTHLGCEHGVCGACSVLVHGQSARACLLLAVQADGTDVVTIEGLCDHPDVRVLTAALARHHGLQCGFCTPAMVVSSVELLRAGGRIDGAVVREHLSGNVCRCTGYQGIVDAVLDASTRLTQSRAITVAPARSVDENTRFDDDQGLSP